MDIPVLLLLNPSSFDVLSYEHMVRQSPTLRWLEETLRAMKLELCEMIVVDMFPMVPDELQRLKKFEDEWYDLVANAFELTLKCLLYIRPRILISCQCCTKSGNEKWGGFGHATARELCSLEAHA